MKRYTKILLALMAVIMLGCSSEIKNGGSFHWLPATTNYMLVKDSVIIIIDRNNLEKTVFIDIKRKSVITK